MNEYPDNWPQIARECKDAAGWRCIRCKHVHEVKTGYVLTVHHWDGDKANGKWWNLLALCQRCHLHIQAKVDPNQPYMWEHADWCKPYAAGFYAYKYHGHKISRAEAEARMDELLSLERVA